MHINPEELSRCIQRLYYWQYKRSNCFSDQLFDLIPKADPANRRKLAKGFPEYILAWEMWSRADRHGDELFEHYGFLPKHEEKA